MVEKHRGRGGITSHYRCTALDAPAVFLSDFKPLLGEAYRGCQGLAQRQATVMLRQVHQRCRFSGYAGGQGAVVCTIAVDFAGGVQEHVRCGRSRRFFTPVDHDFEAITGPVQQPETTAAQATAGGLDHGQGSAHGDGSIERVATLGQHFMPGLGGKVMGAGDRRFARTLFGLQDDRGQQ